MDERNVSHPVETFTALLAERWNHEAAALRHRGLVPLADMVESFANDLVAEANAWLDQSLTLREAAEFGGYSYSALEGRVRVGQLPNAGEQGSPRLRRRDVPLKIMPPPRTLTRAGTDVDDLDQLLKAIDS